MIVSGQPQVFSVMYTKWPYISQIPYRLKHMGKRRFNPCFLLYTFSPSPILMYLGSYDSSVRVWDCKARTYDPVQVLNEAKDSITSLQLTSSEILTG